MHRFWSSVIEPILASLEPEVIVEVGSGHGRNTAQLLEFCRAHGSILHAVDPLPQFDVSAWEVEYGDRLVFHRMRSLDALPQLGSFDAVLIDGDHNWYTVFHELRLIEDLSRQRGDRFPLVLLHDISWPYGRRDLYYDPASIPEAYRKPFQRKGLSLDAPELLQNGGLNAQLYNANYENEPQSGVLTAVEDFLETTQQELEFLKIRGFHGLGILLPVELRARNGPVALFLSNLEVELVRSGFLDSLERSRIEAEIAAQEHRRLRERERAALGAELQARETELAALKADRDALEVELSALKADLQWKGRRLEALMAELRAREGELVAVRAELKAGQKDLKALVRWLERLETGVNTLWTTRRWRAGDLLARLWKRATLRKPEEPGLSIALKQVFSQFHAWKQSGTAVRAPIAAEKGQDKVAGLKKVQADEEPLDRLPSVSHPRAEVVICVHNALSEVRECLAAVVRHTDSRHRIILVDDGSEPECRDYLVKFAQALPGCLLLRNEEARGYTRAANQGLRASQAEYVALLNSDTLVTSNWLEKLIECGHSDQKIGIVGPLSNAASWQSIPERFGPGGDWMVNEAPPGVGPEDIAGMVSAVSTKHWPRVAFLNGFCLAVKRAVINAIGYLDEEAFPDGFGEENDYCLRAARAGFDLAIADQAYVYHAKSKSYSHARRRELAKKGHEALLRKYGKSRVEEGVQALRDEPYLEEVRRKVRRLLEERASPEARGLTKPFGVLFVLAGSGGGGGAHSVVQEALGMRRLGVNAQVAVESRYRAAYRRNYPAVTEEDGLFFFYDSVEDLVAQASEFNVAVATVYRSMWLVKAIVETHPAVMPAYYVQDYEPWFFEPESDHWKLARASYTLIPGTVLFAKNDWLCNRVRQEHGVEVCRVSPSLDQDIFYPAMFRHREEGPVRVAAMIRPRTPRRGADRTMRVLKRLKREFGERVEIHIFGGEEHDLETYGLERDFEFRSHGILIREEVAQLLRQSEVFVDLSDYQALGRTGLEAMACGCAVVLPTKGGVHEYALDGQNALLVNTSSEEACYARIADLVANRDLWHQLSRNAVVKASEYSIRRAVISEWLVLREGLKARGRDATGIERLMAVTPES